MFGKCKHSQDQSLSPCPRLGFLQKNNSLEERSRIVSSLKERTAKSLLSCDNIGRDARFRHTETDFSNMYARGKTAGGLWKIKQKRFVFKSVKDEEVVINCDFQNIFFNYRYM